ncbi:MAG: hypothetical protein AAF039_03295, partial [Bacteroidota bacterium]
DLVSCRGSSTRPNHGTSEPSGILLFAQKSSPRSSKSHVIDQKLLEDFESSLAQLILEILNPNIPFLEKDRGSF